MNVVDDDDKHEAGCICIWYFLRVRCEMRNRAASVAPLKKMQAFLMTGYVAGGKRPVAKWRAWDVMPEIELQSSWRFALHGLWREL